VLIASWVQIPPPASFSYMNDVIFPKKLVENFDDEKSMKSSDSERGKYQKTI
jgi:hypothetical protein